MLIYPQLSTGALAQFPMTRRHRTRTPANVLADGSEIKLDDPGAEVREWELAYSGLSDEEAAALKEFFRETEGSLKGFTWLDPGANLFSWSGRLDLEAWHKDPLLSISGGLTGPLQGTQSWLATNTGSAYQGISQTLQAPGDYGYCFSVYARSEGAPSIRLTRESEHTEIELTADWRRYEFAGCGERGGESVTFGIELPPGRCVGLYGPQLEAQGSASAYQESAAGGVYRDAHFREDTLRLQTTQANCHAATVRIAHAKHL